MHLQWHPAANKLHIAGCLCRLPLQAASAGCLCRLPLQAPCSPTETALPGLSASAEACLWRHEAALPTMLEVLALLLQGRWLLRAHQGLQQLLQLGIARHLGLLLLLLLLVLVLVLLVPRGLQQVQQLLGGQAQPRPAALHLLGRRRALCLGLVQHPRGLLLVQLALQHRVLQQVQPREGAPRLLVVAGGLASLALGLLLLLLARPLDQVPWQASPHARVPWHGHCPPSWVAAASVGLLVGCRLL